MASNKPEIDSQSSTAKRSLVSFSEFAALARARSWTAQSLAARFRGRIDNPTEFFTEVIGGKTPDKIIPYRSVLEFYASAVVNAGRADQPMCACGCGAPVFDRKKWAAPGCRTRTRRKNVRNEQFWLGQMVDFVKPKLRQKRRTGTLPLTERCDALRAD